MCPVKRTPASKRHRQTRRWLPLSFALIVVVALVAIAYIWNPTQTSVNNVSDEPAGFKVFRDHYIAVMQNLNSTETKTKIATQLDPKYNQTDLFTWEHSKLIFVQDST